MNNVTQIKKYFKFETLADGMPILESTYETLHQRYELSECGHIPNDKLRNIFTIPVEFVDLSVSYNFVHSLSVNEFFCNDLFDILKPYLAKEYDFGRIMYNTTIIYEGYVLWKRNESVFLRGNSQSFFWRCKYCGTPRYQTNGMEYILRRDIDERADIITTEQSSMVISEDVFNIIKSHSLWNKFKRKTRIREIAIIDQPRDGFSANLLQTSIEQERRPQWCANMSF
jgi:hypothetical protein